MYHLLHLLQLVIIVSVSAAPGVVPLTTKNFIETVKDRDDDMGFMVKFYAPWCGE